MGNGKREGLRQGRDRFEISFFALFERKDMLHGGGDSGQPFSRACLDKRQIIEAVIHGSHDIVFFEHYLGGLFLVDCRFSAPARLGVIRQRALQLVGKSDVVDHEPARFILEIPIDPGNRLHQPVSAHRFVHIHGMQGGTIESRKPHIADNDDPQRICRVFKPLRQCLAPRLVTNVTLPFRLVRCRPRHDNLDDALVVVIAVPFGA